MNIIIVLLLILLVLSVVGVIRKVRGGTFLPQAERAEDRLFMDKRGRWWGEDPTSGALEETLRPTPEDRREVREQVWGCLKWVLVVSLVVLTIWFLGALIAEAQVFAARGSGTDRDCGRGYTVEPAGATPGNQVSIQAINVQMDCQTVSL